MAFWLLCVYSNVLIKRIRVWQQPHHIEPQSRTSHAHAHARNLPLAIAEMKKARRKSESHVSSFRLQLHVHL